MPLGNQASEGLWLFHKNTNTTRSNTTNFSSKKHFIIFHYVNCYIWPMRYMKPANIFMFTLLKRKYRRSEILSCYHWQTTGTDRHKLIWWRMSPRGRHPSSFAQCLLNKQSHVTCHRAFTRRRQQLSGNPPKPLQRPELQTDSDKTQDNDDITQRPCVLRRSSSGRESDS